MYSRWAPITNEQTSSSPPQQFPITILLTKQQHTRLSSVYHQLWNFTQASDLCRVEPPTSSPTTEYPSVTATVATIDRVRTILPIAKPHKLGKLHWVWWSTATILQLSPPLFILALSRARARAFMSRWHGNSIPIDNSTRIAHKIRTVDGVVVVCLPGTQKYLLFKPPTDKRHATPIRGLLSPHTAGFYWKQCRSCG